MEKLHRDDQHKLWPWPMENRIFSETGVSVTWGKEWRIVENV